MNFSDAPKKKECSKRSDEHYTFFVMIRLPGLALSLWTTPPRMSSSWGLLVQVHSSLAHQSVIKSDFNTPVAFR
jgi:hypothetical protein